jgi:hypothetical protein
LFFVTSARSLVPSDALAVAHVAAEADELDLDAVVAVVVAVVACFVSCLGVGCCCCATEGGAGRRGLRGAAGRTGTACS